MKIAVVGHVEWAEFVQVEQVPRPGEIVAAGNCHQLAAGGGAVAAVQIARLIGPGDECVFLTALGDDELGHRASRDLQGLGVRVEAAWRPSAQRRAFVYLDASGERTITTIGSRLTPRSTDPLPWSELGGFDAVYFTAGDAAALAAARGAGKLVATIRAGSALTGSGVRLDALVASARDDGERYRRGQIEPEPTWVIRTAGARGGSLEDVDGNVSDWESAPLPGPRRDSYGAGDSFAGGLTCGLGQGLPIEESIELGARCGAEAATRRGPYEPGPGRRGAGRID